MQPITSRVNARANPVPPAYTTITGTQIFDARTSRQLSHEHDMATLQRTVGGRTPGERETEADDTNTATDTAPSTSSQDPLAPQANQSRDAEDYVSEY